MKHPGTLVKSGSDEPLGADSL